MFSAIWRWTLAWDYQRQSQKVLSIFRRTGNMLLAARGHWPLAVPSWEASIKVTFSYIIFSISRITLIMGPWNIMVPWRLESISHLWLSRSFIPNSNLAYFQLKSLILHFQSDNLQTLLLGHCGEDSPVMRSLQKSGYPTSSGMNRALEWQWEAINCRENSVINFYGLGKSLPLSGLSFLYLKQESYWHM